PCSHRILLEAEPPLKAFEASIAPAIRRVIDPFVSEDLRSQRQFGFDRTSGRHRSVDAEKFFACSILVAASTTDPEQPRAVGIQTTELPRLRKTPAPDSPRVLAGVRFFLREAPLGGRLKFDRPSFAHKPLVECLGLALDGADPDSPFRRVGIRPLVLTLNGPAVDMRVQSVTRLDP